LLEKPKEGRPLRKFSFKWDDNIQMDIKKINFLKAVIFLTAVIQITFICFFSALCRE